MKISLIIVVILSVMNVATAAGQDSREGKRGEIFKKELNLSDVQLKKVQEIRNEKKDDLKKLKDDFKSNKKIFNEAMGNPQSSKQELIEKFEAFQKSRDEFYKKRFEMMLEMRALLTPLQISKFNELKSKSRDKWKKRNRYKED